MNTPFEGQVFGTHTPEFSGSAGVEPGDAIEVFLELVAVDVNGAQLGSSLSAPIVDGTWKVKPVLSDGLYTATATQSDAAGNSGSSAAVGFSVATVD